MNIDIEIFYKLQRAALHEAKEKCSYYEGYIQGMYEAGSMIEHSRTDKTKNCEEEDHDQSDNKGS